MAAALDRVLAVTPRAAEYFSVKELQAQTGQPEDNFTCVVLKELVDNAIDAAEAAGVAPEIEIIVDGDGDHLTLVVADNGPGLPVETLDRTLDFNVRASTNSCYRSPTRGLQGNALKTVFGIVYALGGKAPVTIEAHGVCHIISVWLDPAGHVRIDRQQEQSDVTAGTRIMVSLPGAVDDLMPESWARAFAVLNPHAGVKVYVRDKNYPANTGQAIFEKTADFTNGWKKYIPTDATSPHWYQPADLERLVFAILGAGNGNQSLTVRDFVRQFRGLTGSAKAKQVCDQFPGINTLADLETDPGAIRGLLDAMKSTAVEPKPSVLGCVGADHFQKSFERHGLHEGRFWYKKSEIVLAGVPYLIEAAVGETDEGALYHGVNFSPTFDDPLAGESIHCSAADIYSTGLQGFLYRAYCHPNSADDQGHEVAVALHLVSPSLQFLDRGKTRLSIPHEVGVQVAKCLWSVCKTLCKEEKQRRRDAARRERAIGSILLPRRREPSVKDVVFDLVPEAEKLASGGIYDVSARDLYYATQPLLKQVTNRKFEYNYFTQALLPEYQRIYGPIERLYYDPRGTLYEPHTGEVIPIGTREVEKYNFPEYTFDKILYIEKKGRAQILQTAKIPERYDIALIGAEGYATEAARMLFQKADRDQRYQLFVLHDADPAGYNIARTLREETRRMPGYKVDVIDLGLNLQEALDMGLQTESFSRKNQLPGGLVLTDVEREHFEGRQVGRRQWIAQRVELNAMTAPQFVEYVERKLTEAGAATKVIPPKQIIVERLRDQYEKKIYSRVEEQIMEKLDIDSMVQDALAKIPEPSFDAAEVTEKLDGLPEISWRDAVNEIVGRAVDRALE